MTVSPRLVILDSSHLGQWFADRASDHAAERARATAFEARMEAGGYVPLLCWHHFEELLQHENTLTSKRRVRALHSLPRLAWLATVGEDALGSIVDLLAAEAGVAYYHQAASPADIVAVARPLLLRVGRPRDFLGDNALKWLAFQPLFKEREARAREIVAIKRSNFVDLSKTKVIDLMRGGIASEEERKQRFVDLTAKLATSVAATGDKRIPNANSVANTFIAEVAQMVETLPGNAAELVLETLFSRGVTPADLTPDATVGAMNDLATFRMELKVVSKKLDIAWRDLNARVSMDRVPSTIVAHALDRHGPELPEYKGSELNDEYLLRLGLYADRTYVDKRTLEGLRRAKAKVPILKDLLPDVRRAANYSEMTFEH